MDEARNTIRTGGNVPDQAAEEWPPRAWRETTRSAGHRQALYITLGMIAMFAVLVVINIWGSHQG